MHIVLSARVENAPLSTLFQPLPTHSIPIIPAQSHYDEDFKNLRTIIESGQSQLIGEGEEVLARLADLARNMRKRKRS
jgi:hypothetical protein